MMTWPGIAWLAVAGLAIAKLVVVWHKYAGIEQAHVDDTLIYISRES